MSNNILVVGGAGYVGGHTAKALSRAGYLPIIFDNLSTGHRTFAKWGPLVEADLLDPGALERAIKDYDVAAVLHFAASAYVGESVEDPEKYYRNNVSGSLSLLSALRRVGSIPVVFSSTCAIYGQPKGVPIRESTPKAPINPYGRSKLVVEQMLEDFCAAYGQRYAALRYFNACGADPDGEIGEFRDPETHLIPRAMMSIQGHVADFQVFGGDFATPDGTAIRDYIHVADLADAHVIAVRQLLDGWAGGAMNLGTGHGYSVREVLDEIAAVTGASLPKVTGPRRSGDPAVLIADASEARDQLAFSPKRSTLNEIVSTAWAWHQVAHPKR